MKTALVWILVLVSLIVGIAIGAVAHDKIAGLFHRHEDATASSEPGQLWTCGMHPQVIQDKPGNCPICGMALEPLSPPAGDHADGAITIDPVVVQNMGVRTAAVTRGAVRRTIRAVGYLEEAQPRRYDVNLRVSGWIEKLYADTEGAHLRQGDQLFELYSPAVSVALEELISARRALDQLADDSAQSQRRSAQITYDAALRKLELWGLSSEEVQRLAKLDQPPRTITFVSPIEGHVVEKNVVEGAAVNAGDRVLRIVDHTVLWLDAQVYAQDLPLVEMGQTVTATIEGAAAGTITGEIIFIHPHVDPMTRTALVRIAVANPDLTLRPGMFATARIEAALAEDVLLVPDEAVIDTGARQVVFVSRGEGKFEPREIERGLAGDDGAVQVVKGLETGETVVTSGQFLLDAESRMKEAIQKHLSKGLAEPNREHNHP